MTHPLGTRQTAAVMDAAQGRHRAGFRAGAARGLGFSLVVPPPFAPMHEIVRRYQADMQASGNTEYSLTSREGCINARAPKACAVPARTRRASRCWPGWSVSTRSTSVVCASAMARPSARAATSSTWPWSALVSAR